MYVCMHSILFPADSLKRTDDCLPVCVCWLETTQSLHMKTIARSRSGVAQISMGLYVSIFLGLRLTGLLILITVILYISSHRLSLAVPALPISRAVCMSHTVCYLFPPRHLSVLNILHPSTISTNQQIHGKYYPANKHRHKQQR